MREAHFFVAGALVSMAGALMIFDSLVPRDLGGTPLGDDVLAATSAPIPTTSRRPPTTSARVVNSKASRGRLGLRGAPGGTCVLCVGTPTYISGRQGEGNGTVVGTGSPYFCGDLEKWLGQCNSNDGNYTCDAVIDAGVSCMSSAELFTDQTITAVARSRVMSIASRPRSTAKQ